MKQIIEVLVYVHGVHKMGHGDTKAENMLLFNDGLQYRLKAGDWDCASQFGEDRRREATKATPCARQTRRSLSTQGPAS